MTSEDTTNSGANGAAEMTDPATEATAEQAPAAEATPEPPAEEADADAEPSLEDKLEAATAKAEANRNKMLRVAADFENFRKRSLREVSDARKRGMQEMVKDLLAVFDNLERATTNVDSETGVESMAEGLRMVHRQFVDLIGKRGIERIEALGQAFDPMLHEAIQYDYSDEYDAGTVMVELQQGYKMDAHLLRPSMVMVSRGAAPAAVPAETTGDAEQPTDDGGEQASEAAPGKAADPAEVAEGQESNGDSG